MSDPVSQSDNSPDRILSVHALGQFVFCPRSAVLASELGDDTDVDEAPPRLDYVPNYDLRLISEEWSRVIWWSVRVLLLMALSFVILMAAVLLESRLLFYPAMATFTSSCVWLGRKIPVLCKLRCRMYAAMHARAREPHPEGDRVVAVSWWDMLQAGFEPRALAMPIRHPHMPLEGSPWRVLERGSLRIPVVRSGGKKLGPARWTVYDKHRIRLAAYALLLEAAPHTWSPYGIVLPFDGHKGLAVPLDSQVRSHVPQVLELLRVTLLQSKTGVAQPVVAGSARCAACPHGEPIPIKEPEAMQLMKQGKRLLLLEQVDGRRFHCTCGDRFGSAPPHKKSLRLALISRMQ